MTGKVNDMKNGLLTIFSLFLLIAVPAFSQHPPTGFYIVIDDKANCPNLVHTLTGEEIYCLPKEPVITETEFESIGDIIHDKTKRQQHFDLRLSPAGLKTLTALAERLPDSRVALVIGGHVAGIYESRGKISNRTLAVRGNMDSPDIDWIHNRVKKKP